MGCSLQPQGLGSGVLMCVVKCLHNFGCGTQYIRCRQIMWLAQYPATSLSIHEETLHTTLGAHHASSRSHFSVLPPATYSFFTLLDPGC